MTRTRPNPVYTVIYEDYGVTVLRTQKQLTRYLEGSSNGCLWVTYSGVYPDRVELGTEAVVKLIVQGKSVDVFEAEDSKDWSFKVSKA
jgi:hypothetical protein